MSDFVHLSLHSEYALRDSLVRIKPLMAAVREKGMGAVAVTDPDNLFALVRSQQAAQSSGIKLIAGAEVRLSFGASIDDVTLIAKDYASYIRLSEAISEGYINAQGVGGRPVVLAESLKGSNLICMCGGRSSTLGLRMSQNPDQAEAMLRELQGLFANELYIKLARVGHPLDNEYVRSAVYQASKLEIPVVAVNDVRFLDRNSHASHDIRVKIAHKDNGYDSGVTAEQYLKSPEEMVQVFADIPSAIANTVVIAQKASLEVPLGKVFLPNAPVPNGMSENDYLDHSAKEGLLMRLDKLSDRGLLFEEREYHDRLDYELSVIKQMGFAGYFLIVADFIRWAKSKSIPVGPGRGSGAGSLVAYSLGITDLDPLEYGLLFERFLNPERVSMPDFDVDFCMDRRDEVIQYVTDTYGRDAVSQIITFGTMAAKMVVRDVARALGHPYIFGDKLAKMIPAEIGIKLSQAIEAIPELQQLYDTDEEVREVLDHALALEGLTRQVGKHAGGVLIAPGKLTSFTPLYADPEGTGLVSQYDKDDVEAAGLVKFDFLGLRTLTILQEAVNAIHTRHTNVSVDLLQLPLDDAKTFDLIKNSETAAVFQLESHGMRRLISGLQPSSFEEIIALVALFRPGPLQAGMVEDYIARKHGRAEVKYPHPLLEKVLAPTYGVFVYQEQVMEAARVLAGYTLGQADILRKAMGKKKPEEMAKQRSVFIQGCKKANNISEDESGAIFDLIDKFAGYGFNKSHSAGYALLSFQTAYLKAHYPAEFMAAVLSSEMHDTDVLIHSLAECKRMGLKITLPNVNVSGARFVVDQDGSLAYGLEAIKGVGSKIVSVIVCERTVNGPFKSIADFCSRTSIDRRALTALAKAGALDDFAPHRAAVMAQLETATDAAKQMKKAGPGQEDMFGIEAENLVGHDVPAWPLKTLLKFEMESFGCFVSGHPIASYDPELKSVISGKFVDLAIPDEKTGRVETRQVSLAGYVVAMQVNQSRRGSFARVRIDDGTSQFELFVPAKLFAEAETHLKPGEMLVIDGRLEHDEYSDSVRVMAREIITIDQFREQYARRLVITLNPDSFDQDVQIVQSILTDAPQGPCNVYVRVPGESQKVINLDLGIVPTLRVTDEIEAMLGPVVSIETSTETVKFEPSHASSTAKACGLDDEDVRRERLARIEALFSQAEALMSA